MQSLGFKIYFPNDEKRQEPQSAEIVALTAVIEEMLAKKSYKKPLRSMSRSGFLGIFNKGIKSL